MYNECITRVSGVCSGYIGSIHFFSFFHITNPKKTKVPSMGQNKQILLNILYDEPCVKLISILLFLEGKQTVSTISLSTVRPSVINPDDIQTSTLSSGNKR